MNKANQSAKARMIHIRLDEETHRRLKIHVAQHGKTIQETVERLIRQILPPSERKTSEK